MAVSVSDICENTKVRLNSVNCQCHTPGPSFALFSGYIDTFLMFLFYKICLRTKKMIIHEKMQLLFRSTLFWRSVEASSNSLHDKSDELLQNSFFFMSFVKQLLLSNNKLSQ